MTIEKIVEEIKASPHQKIKVAVTDVDGVIRGKVIHKEKFLGVLQSGFGFCDVVLGWDSSDLCYEEAGVTFTGWHTGYPDAQAEVDIHTFRKIPWENDLPFFLADFRNAKGETHEICPRGLLRTICDQVKADGFTPYFGPEFEWFNFRESPASLAEKKYKDPTPITPGMFGYSVLRASQNSDFFNDIYDLLFKFNIPLEGLHTETGPGVYEAAILYDEAHSAADKAVLFKSSLKEIGHRYGIMPSFMAKWNEKLPGCSGHLHQSLWRNGKNLFYDEKDPLCMSETMKSYIAGMLYALPEILPMFAPTVNSYKRLVEGMWAPTTITWGIDNRTTALRILPGTEKSTRVEHRVVGSDVNPYLAIAASLAGGIYGVRNKLKLEIPPTAGNGYVVKTHGVLPRNLYEAAQAMNKSALARELFGTSFVEHFTATRIWEWRQFSQVVTDWEMKRYFEII